MELKVRLPVFKMPVGFVASPGESVPLPEKFTGPPMVPAVAP